MFWLRNYVTVEMSTRFNSWIHKSKNEILIIKTKLHFSYLHFITYWRFQSTIFWIQIGWYNRPKHVTWLSSFIGRKFLNTSLLQGVYQFISGIISSQNIFSVCISNMGLLFSWFWVTRIFSLHLIAIYAANIYRFPVNFSY